jgi:hypothetical protein
MAVKGPASPLSSSGGAEPLEPLHPNELPRVVKSGQFESQLNALDAASNDGAATHETTSSLQSETVSLLRQIAASADLSTPAQALDAIRESARFMIQTRIQQKFQQNQQVEQMIEDLSVHVANDPLLQRKMLRILQKLKED